MSDFQFMPPILSLKRLTDNSLSDKPIYHNCDMEHIGKKIRALRESEARQMSQGDLAKAAKVSQTTIADLERGRNDSSRRMTSIASALGVTAEQLERLGSAELLRIQASKDAPLHSAPSFPPSGHPQPHPLIERYESADEATRTLIELALTDPGTPMPQGLSPSLRHIVEAARTAIREQQQKR